MYKHVFDESAEKQNKMTSLGVRRRVWNDVIGEKCWGNFRLNFGENVADILRTICAHFEGNFGDNFDDVIGRARACLE